MLTSGCPVELLEQIYQAVLSLGTNLSGDVTYTSSGQKTVTTDKAFPFVVTLSGSGGAILAENITPGTRTLVNISTGWTGTPTAAFKMDGMVVSSTVLSSEVFSVGDSFFVRFDGIAVTVNGVTQTLPQIYIFGNVADESDLYTDVAVIRDILENPNYGNEILKSAIDAVLVELESVGGNVESAQSALSGAVSDIATVDGVVDAIKLSLDDAATGIVATNVVARAVAGSVTAVYNKVFDVQSSVSNVDGDVAAVKSVVDAVKADVEHATTGLPAIKQQGGALATAVSTVDVRIQALNNLSYGHAQAAAKLAVGTDIASLGITPAANSVAAALCKSGTSGFNRTTDSLEALRDRMDELLGANHNLVNNGGFESAITGSWTVVGNVTRLAAMPRSGSYCARFVGNGSISQTIATLPTGVSIGPDRFLCRAWFLGSPSGKFLLSVYPGSAPDLISSFEVQSSGFTADWQCAEFVVQTPVMPPSNPGVTVVVSTTGMSSSDTIYVDDVSLNLIDLNPVSRLLPCPVQKRGQASFTSSNTVVVETITATSSPLKFCTAWFDGSALSSAGKAYVRCYFPYSNSASIESNSVDVSSYIPGAAISHIVGNNSDEFHMEYGVVIPVGGRIEILFDPGSNYGGYLGWAIVFEEMRGAKDITYDV